MAGSNSQHALAIIKGHVNFDATAATGSQWRRYPEIPTARDLNPDWDDEDQLDEIHNVPHNNVDKPWLGKDAYLETHYRLQREEAITILRYTVKKFREDPRMEDDQQSCVYTRVFVRGYLMTRLGPMCRVHFSTERAGKKIHWKQTKRLVTGTLVVLSTAQDAFKTICLPAVIADRPLRDGLDQNPPTIQFFWAKTEEAILDPTLELVMLEARSGYFESLRHSMVGLQHAADNATPLDKYLVQADKSDLPAAHIQQNPMMNVSSLVHHIPNSAGMPVVQIQERLAEARAPLTNASVIEGFDNRLQLFTNLDNSQLSAVNRILSKELAIVQGPPGTGKTFTSVQALQIMLESQPQGKHVIVVAAQTNHAVDQILIQLIQRDFQVLRLGGRTQNEDISRHNMYNLRRRSMPAGAQKTDRDYRNFETARKKNISSLESIIDDVFPPELLDPAVLCSAGIISQSQLESLQEDAEWSGAEDDTEQPQTVSTLSTWLGDQLVEVPSTEYSDTLFETSESEDGDHEAEEHDIELDDCIVDDDENRGRVMGKWVPVKHRWTGANPQNRGEGDADIQQDLKKSNLWDINQKRRGAIYQHWQRRLLKKSTRQFRGVLADTTRICKNLKINRWYKDMQCIKSSRIEIVGCTTTGLCKYRGLLAALQPRTLLVEEAAETKEANIMSAMFPSLQQLILVGDHEQLAPSTEVPELAAKPFNLRVSMFQRLVQLEMPYTMLNMQRRMIPALREVLNPFYPDLQDHPVVTKESERPPVPGMDVPSFFFHHTWGEGIDENFSKYNELESEFITRFINYLLLNGVQESEITVLTFYRGQRKQILSDARKTLGDRASLISVHTVDSYQGEENDIVLLSLVRSHGLNGPHRAGFLEDQNRGVVSISRARRGFYVFGNMINLAGASWDSYWLWTKVAQTFQRQGRYGEDSRFPITCQQHGTTTFVKHPDDWINHHGGCDRPCTANMPCGHPCGRNCHWIDHSRLICQLPCERPLHCGHKCEEICGNKCFCRCNNFTGAYANDDSWDDKAAADGVKGVLEAQNSAVVRGRQGLRGQAIHFLRGRTLGADSDPNGSMIRDLERPSNASGAIEWNRFNGPQHDQQMRQLRNGMRQLQGIGGPVILETLRPATLSPGGRRNLGKAIVTRYGPDGAPLNAHDGTVGNKATKDSFTNLNGPALQGVASSSPGVYLGEQGQAMIQSMPQALQLDGQTNNLEPAGSPAASDVFADQVEPVSRAQPYRPEAPGRLRLPGPSTQSKSNNVAEWLMNNSAASEAADGGGSVGTEEEPLIRL
ncbi:P-loop containing nucleoside triphosphate hydrolase protein [Xylariaceae sp. FL0804]|nr:P-loop containing nucleoside triphosphate hydrolase protein [Xylariaceae sp. FL0804]